MNTLYKKVSWVKYNEQIDKKGPRNLCIKGLKHVQGKEKALDFGAGSLVDTNYLLSQGFMQIIVVDADSDTAERVSKASDTRVEFFQTTFEAYKAGLDKFDFINAQHSIGFISEKEYNRTVTMLIDSLKVGGILAANFFGDRDDWNTPNSGKTCVTKDRVMGLLKGCELILFDEIENDKNTAMGRPKHWHMFNVIAKKLHY